VGIPQDWAPYSSVEEAAKVYLRDPDLALDQLRSVIDLSAIKSFIMSRGSTEESWGDAVWQEVVLTDGLRLIMWRADDELSPTRNTIPQALDLETLKRKPCYTAEQTVTDEDLSSSSFKEHSLGRANQAAFFSSQGS